MIEFALGQPLVLFIINQKNFNHFCQRQIASPS